VAALFVAGLLPLVVLAGPVGRLVDRADSRVLLVTSSLVQAAICLALAYATSNAAILCLVAALGCGEAVNGATWQALVPSIVGTDGIARATVVLQSSRTAASIVAPALAGALVGAFGTRAPLLVDVGSYLAITIAALTIPTRRRVGVEQGGEDVRSGWAIVRADRMLRSVLSMLAVFVVLGASVVVVEVFLIRETLHSSPTWYGIAVAAWGVAMFVGAAGGGRLLRSDDVLARALLIGVIGLSLSMIGFALCRNVGQVIAVSAVGGIANGLVNLAGTTLIARRPAPEARGRVAAVASGVLSASLVAAYALGGVAAAFVTPREVYVAGGVLGLFAPLLMGRSVLRAVRAATIAAIASDQVDAGRSSQAA
jgi:MFS family permease